MAFLSKIGCILRQTAARTQLNAQLSGSRPGLFQVVRCMSSTPSSKLFIGGISFQTDDQSLAEAFSKYGEVVEAKVIVDRETGRSRGFGFVTYTSIEHASSALQALDGQALHGRQVRVDYAAERPRRNFGGGGYGGGGYGGGGYGGGGGGYSGGGGGYGGGGYGGNDRGEVGYGNSGNFGGQGSYGGDGYGSNLNQTTNSGGGGGYGGGGYGGNDRGEVGYGNSVNFGGQGSYGGDGYGSNLNQTTNSGGGGSDSFATGSDQLGSAAEDGFKEENGDFLNEAPTDNSPAEDDDAGDLAKRV